MLAPTCMISRGYLEQKGFDFGETLCFIVSALFLYLLAGLDYCACIWLYNHQNIFVYHSWIYIVYLIGKLFFSTIKYPAHALVVLTQDTYTSIYSCHHR